MADAHANFALTTVATAPVTPTAGTSLVVAAGTGVKFPAAPFNATIWPAGSTPSTANAEIVRVTAVSTDTLTITRTQESTTARTVVAGDQIVAGITAKTLTDVEGVFSGFYGDGSDGNVTISTTVTLTRDMFYDTLTVSGTGVLQPNGYRVFCKTALNVQASGILRYNGNAAVGATPGANNVNASGTLGAGNTGGGTGGTGPGGNGNSASASYGGASGAGGIGAGNGGGASRPATAPTAAQGTVRQMPQAALGLLLTGTVTPIQGGAAGSAGGGDGTNSGGGGGGGGCVLVINARAVTNSGTISADGGAGGNTSAGNTGGGGGGGGGVVIVNTASALTGSNPTANGGTFGTKTGTGANGSAGSAGNVFVNVWI